MIFLDLGLPSFIRVSLVKKASKVNISPVGETGFQN